MTFRLVRVALLSLALGAPAVAQRTPAPEITNPDDPKFLTPLTRQQGGIRPPEQMALEIRHLDLATTVFPAEKRIESVATLTLGTSARVEEIVLDLYPKFAIGQIVVGGRKIPPSGYSNPEGRLRIKLPRAFESGGSLIVKIAYSGTPPLAKRPPWEGGTTWLRTPDDKHPWIDTSLWGGGCDLLFPCIDHPTRKAALVDLHYTVPTGLMAPGNGVLVSKVERKGWTTWNWRARSPHTYGMVLNVGPYLVLEGDYASRYGNAIPMRFYYLPGEEEKAKELFAEFPQTLRFWEDVIGPYPWADQKMGVIRVPFSGLENQTLIGYSIDYPKTAFGWDWLLNHEFAHEYFANHLLGELRRSVAARRVRLVCAAAARRVVRRRARLFCAAAQPARGHPERAAARRRTRTRREGGVRGSDRPARRRLHEGQLGRTHAAPAHRRRGVLRVAAHPALRPARSEAGQFHAAVPDDAGLPEDRQ